MVVPGVYFYLPRHLLDRTGHYLCFLLNRFIGGELELGCSSCCGSLGGARSVASIEEHGVCQGLCAVCYLALHAKDSCGCSLLAEEALSVLNGS